MNNLIKRTVPVILVVCCIFLGLSVPFVSAESVGSLNNNSSPYLDLLPYLSVENPITFNGSTERYIGFSSAPVADYSYIDILFYTDSTDFSIPMYAGGATVYHIDGDLYRAFGQMYYDSHNNMSPYFYIDCNNGSYFTFVSCKVTLQDFSPVAIPYSYKLATPYNSVSGTFSVGSANVSAPFDTNIPDISDGSLLSYFISLTLETSIQKKFDYVSIPLSISCNDISSIRVNQGDLPVEFTYNFFNPTINESTSNRTRYIYLLIDLTSLDRSSNVPISVYIDGSFASGNGSLTYFHDAYGYISIESNPIQYWIAAHTASVKSYFDSLTSKLSNWFSTNFTWLSNILDELKKLNGDDSEAVQAIQTQEEINVSVNNQLVGAVEDWNTNIEVVQTGYDSAVTKATPALGWLASLADRIFTNMGWFGNIYFLVGLISVIMLVLSKSGLARSVSRFRRNE